VTTPQLRIPADLLPSDGRFGAGPSKIRPAQVEALAATGRSLLGTSHRQQPVRAQVGRLRAGLRELFSLPDGYEVVLGNGGATEFWDIATFGLISSKSQHLSFGEFSSKFAAAARAAPFLDDPSVITSDAGRHPLPVAEAGVDLYALTHNETSTGVAMPIAAVEGADEGASWPSTRRAAPGGLPVDAAQFDVYYFSPQKSFASDGGLWLALMSPAALERVAAVKASGRWVPASYDLGIAVDNSRLDQTYNTPAVATLFLMAEQVDWMNARAASTGPSAHPRLERRPLRLGRAEPGRVAVRAGPGDALAGHRDDRLRRLVDAAALAAVPAGERRRRHRALPQARPQPAAHRHVPGDRAVDVEALTACVDHVVEALS
jgi:phosphoserine aminotransferase